MSHTICTMVLYCAIIVLHCVNKLQRVRSCSSLQVMSNTLQFNSRRGVICASSAAVACSQPLAAEIGHRILQRGGNAADAAVAVAAALNLTQPTSTGIGGDVFVLFYDAKEKTVKGINGSGRAPASLTLARANADGFNENNPIPQQHGHAVTVPGAAAAWIDTVELFGSGNVTISDILQPTIELAEKGFPLSQTTAYYWKNGEALLTNPQNTWASDLLIDGRAPKWGEVFRNPNLADTFRTLASSGKAGFYEGRIAEAIVAACATFGGVMATEDLRNHVSTFDDPVHTSFKEVKLWEMPPNSQGVVALMTLNLLETFDLQGMGHNSTEYLHTLIEALRLSFADAATYVADPTVSSVPTKGMLSKEYASERRTLINPDSAMTSVPPGDPWPYNMGDDTVYFSVVDSQGNACSFINSNYQGFGTAIVPQACGFTLQNRGCNFSLVPDHPNVLAPNKRPYHTIIPAMVTSASTGNLLCCYGVMGGFMQPQGHVQVLLNMVEFGMDPQQALDQSRICIGNGESGAFGAVDVEDGIAQSVIDGLVAKGHETRGPLTGYSRGLFGWGQAITRGAWWKDSNNDTIVDEETVLWVGVDPRSDGSAVAN